MNNDRGKQPAWNVPTQIWLFYVAQKITETHWHSHLGRWENWWVSGSQHTHTVPVREHRSYIGAFYWHSSAWDRESGEVSGRVVIISQWRRYWKLSGVCFYLGTWRYHGDGETGSMSRSEVQHVKWKEKSHSRLEPNRLWNKQGVPVINRPLNWGHHTNVGSPGADVMHPRAFCVWIGGGWSVFMWDCIKWSNYGEKKKSCHLFSITRLVWKGAFCELERGYWDSSTGYVALKQVYWYQTGVK